MFSRDSQLRQSIYGWTLLWANVTTEEFYHAWILLEVNPQKISLVPVFDPVRTRGFCPSQSILTRLNLWWTGSLIHQYSYHYIFKKTPVQLGFDHVHYAVTQFLLPRGKLVYSTTDQIISKTKVIKTSWLLCLLLRFTDNDFSTFSNSHSLSF